MPKGELKAGLPFTDISQTFLTFLGVVLAYIGQEIFRHSEHVSAYAVLAVGWLRHLSRSPQSGTRFVNFVARGRTRLCRNASPGSIRMNREAVKVFRVVLSKSR